MNIRGQTALVFIFITISAPSFAQALDLFEYIDNVLGVETQAQTNLGQNVSSKEEADDMKGYILIPNPEDAKKTQPQSQPAVVRQNSIKLPTPSQRPPSILRQLPQKVGPQFTLKPKILREAPKMETKILGAPAPAIPKWNEDKKAHWLNEVRQYYGEYIVGEASMSRLERETKIFENALFYDKTKARSLDPNRYDLRFNAHNIKADIRWRVEPFIYLNFDVEKKITNMLPYVAGKNSPDQKIILQPGPRSEYGYEVNKKISFEVGGGAGLFAWPIGGFVSAGAVISEAKGISRHTQTADENLDMSVTGRPTVDNIINHWNIGESYHYDLSGEFLVSGGASWTFISAGVTHVKGASSEHTITKIGPDKVMVEVANFKNVSQKMSLSAVIAGVSSVTENEIKKMHFTFFYDLSMPAGRRAFVQLMNGNYVDTMALIAENQTVAVALIEKDISRVYLDRRSGDYMTSWYLGLPPIFWNWSYGNTSDEGALTSYIDSIETRYYHKLYSENFYRRLLFDHKYVTSAFYAGIEQAGRANSLTPDPNQDYYGRFIWNFQDESARRQTLRDQLDKLIYTATGLEELDVDMGNISRNLGYTNAEVIMHFNKETTNLLMGTLEGGGSDLIASFHRAVDQYASMEYPKEIDFCENWDGRPPYYVRHDTDPSKIKSKATLKAECVTLIHKTFELKVKDMVKELRKMFDALKINDDASKQRFVTAYRHFGELMMTNRFTFRAVYDFLLDVGAGDIIRYIINGENLANMVMYFPSGKVEAPLTVFQK